MSGSVAAAAAADDDEDSTSVLFSLALRIYAAYCSEVMPVFSRNRSFDQLNHDDGGGPAFLFIDDGNDVVDTEEEEEEEDAKEISTRPMRSLYAQ